MSATAARRCERWFNPAFAAPRVARAKLKGRPAAVESIPKAWSEATTRGIGAADGREYAFRDLRRTTTTPQARTRTRLLSHHPQESNRAVACAGKLSRPWCSGDSAHRPFRCYRAGTVPACRWDSVLTGLAVRDRTRWIHTASSNSASPRRTRQNSVCRNASCVEQTWC